MLARLSQSTSNMIIDKPDWIGHAIQPIWCIDIDPEGVRAVTAGSDNKVRVWNLAPILSARAEKEPSVPKALATITDHLSAVNVARFSPKGHFIASGSDEKLVLLHQLMPGQGQTAFGSKDLPNVENWRQVHVMRGHNSNISDIAWCPDGTKLASSSLDNSVIVWDAASGRQLATLEGHHGNVKGLAWDPFDHYLASHGDSDGVIIWSTADWSKVVHVTEPWPDKMSAGGFHARPGWSPDGQTLAGTCAFNMPVHQAPLIERNKWTAPHQLCGHKSSVIVAKYNPHLFYSKQKPDSDEAVGICALGSQDRMITVWAIDDASPLAICAGVFTSVVMDLAWTPDGMTLLACSYDGTVASITFTEQELGRRLPEKDMSELLLTLYGDQQPKGRALLADAQLLALDMDLDGPSPTKSAPQAAPKAPQALAAAGMVAGAGAAAAAQRLGVAGGGLKPGAAAALDSRMGPGGAGLGAAAGPSGAAGQGARKRLAPTLMDSPTAAGGTAAAAGRPGAATALDSRMGPGGAGLGAAAGPSGATGGPLSTRQAPAAPTTAAGALAQAAKRIAPQAMPQARPSPAQTGVVPQAPAPVASETALGHLLAAPQLQAGLSYQLGSRPVAGATHTSQQEPLYLEALNQTRVSQQSAMARVQCSASGRVLWFDTMQGSVVQITGTLRFSAVSLTTGDLLIFSAAGRRLFPPMALGGPAAFMGHNDEWMLLVLTADGQVSLWDVEAGVCKLDVSLAPVLKTLKSEVSAVRITSAGAPLVVLANRHAYTYLEGMKKWGRVADDSFPASQFHSSFAGVQGELGRVQSEAAAARRPRDVMGAALAQPLDVQNRATRAHLESNVAAARALQSPYEWKRWLSSYVRLLATDGDEARLREVVQELLGPVRWSPETHPSEQGGWSPEVLGYHKRVLLRNDILREIMRPRTAALQALAQETLALLNEAESVYPSGQSQQQAGQNPYQQLQQQQQQQQQQRAAVAGPFDGLKTGNGALAPDASRAVGVAQQEDRGARQGLGQGLPRAAATGGVTGVMPPAAPPVAAGASGQSMTWLHSDG